MRRSVLTSILLALVAAVLVIPGATAQEPAYQATIRRTSNGIPHILADSYADVAFGFGYAFAEDNICTAADFYVTVNGQRSKYFGPDNTWGFNGNGTTNTNRESDFFYTAVNQSGRIEELLAMEPPHGPSQDIRDAVRGYVAGYNRYLADVGGPDGISDPRCSGAEWVRPITEMDAYRRFYQLASLASRGVAIDEIGGAQPPTPDTGGDQDGAQERSEEAVVAEQIRLLTEELPSRFHEALGIGSNAYGFGSEVTDNGRGMVLGNPHFPWHGGERLYQFQLTVPGVVNVSGAALYGVPLVLIGHTDGLAWSHTVSTAYRFTPFELTLVPGSPTTYLVDGQPMEMERTEVTIELEDGSTESRTLYSTIYGPITTGVLGLPIFPWTPARAFAMADANDHLRYLNHFFEKNHAQSVEELLEVIERNQGVPWVNTIAADRNGRVLYSDKSVVPNVPDSKAQVCNTEVGAAAFEALGLPVLDGARSDCNWDTDDDAVVPGIFGPANLPHLFRDDYVTNSNDSYWLSNPQEPLTGFARIIGDEETERTLRTRLGLVMVEDRLSGADEYVDRNPDRFTQPILRDVVFNNRQYAGELVRDDLVAHCRSLPGGYAPTYTYPNPLELDTGTPTLGPPVEVGDACDVLENWDLRDDLDSAGAILFRRFWTHAGNAFPDGPWVNPFDVNDPVHTPNTLDTTDPLVSGALGQAIQDLRDYDIPLDAGLRGWQYEDRGDGEEIPIHGGPGALGVFNAINVGWNSDVGGYPDVDHGSSFVMAVQFTDGCPLTSAIVTYSQSEDITSPWFKDQTRMFSNKEWNDMHFCEEDILADPALVVTTVSSGDQQVEPAPVPDDTSDDSGAPVLPTTGGGLAALALVGALLAGRRRR